MTMLQVYKYVAMYLAMGAVLYPIFKWGLSVYISIKCMMAVGAPKSFDGLEDSEFFKLVYDIAGMLIGINPIRSNRERLKRYVNDDIAFDRKIFGWIRQTVTWPKCIAELLAKMPEVEDYIRLKKAEKGS